MSFGRRRTCSRLGLQSSCCLDWPSLFWCHRQHDGFWSESQPHDRVCLPKARARHRRSLVAHISQAQISRFGYDARRRFSTIPGLQCCPPLSTVEWSKSSGSFAKTWSKWTMEVCWSNFHWSLFSTIKCICFSYIHTTRWPHKYGQSIEVKTQLNQRDYLNMLAQKDDAHFTIFKKRRCFLVNNQYFQLDTYQEPSHPR